MAAALDSGIDSGWTGSTELLPDNASHRPPPVANQFGAPQSPAIVVRTAWAEHLDTPLSTETMTAFPRQHVGLSPAVAAECLSFLRDERTLVVVRGSPPRTQGAQHETPTRPHSASVPQTIRPRLPKASLQLVRTSAAPAEAPAAAEDAAARQDATATDILSQSSTGCSSRASNSDPICRICHEGPSRERLLSPCSCKGTVGLIHQTCIECWLSAANIDSCEICRHPYVTVRKDRPFSEWLTKSGDPANLRNFIADVCCLVLLTPLTAVSTWLCMSGALLYYTHPAGHIAGWEAIALFLLSSFLVLVYFIWCMVAGRYHFRMYHQWRRSHQIVTLLVTPQLIHGHARPTPANQPGDSAPATIVVDKTDPSPTRFTTAAKQQQTDCPTGHAFLYRKSQVDGQWLFGRLPARSLSDTAVTSYWSWHALIYEEPLETVASGKEDV